MTFSFGARECFGITEAVAEEAELACLVLLDGASQPLPLLLRSSEAELIDVSEKSIHMWFSWSDSMQMRVPLIPTFLPIQLVLHPHIRITFRKHHLCTYSLTFTQTKEPRQNIT